MQGKFDLGYFIKGSGLEDWWKALGLGWRLIVFGVFIFFLISGIRGCFVKEPKNVNKPHVVVTPFAKVEKIDQSNVQVSIDEKTWEVGIGAGALTFDNKNGGLIGGWVRRRF